MSRLALLQGLGPAARALRWGVILVVVAVTAAVSMSSAFGSSSSPAVTAREVASGSAPAFRLTSLASGPQVSLPPIGREPVILSFFASWCDGCRMEMGTVSKLAAHAKGHVQIIGIDVSDQAAQARPLLSEYHITYPVGVDHGYQVAAQYGLVDLPTTVYVNAEHTIVGRTIGPLTSKVGQAWLQTLETSR